MFLFISSLLILVFVVVSSSATKFSFVEDRLYFQSTTERIKLMLGRYIDIVLAESLVFLYPHVYKYQVKIKSRVENEATLFISSTISNKDAILYEHVHVTEYNLYLSYYVTLSWLNNSLSVDLNTSNNSLKMFNWTDPNTKKENVYFKRYFGISTKTCSTPNAHACQECSHHLPWEVLAPVTESDFSLPLYSVKLMDGSNPNISALYEVILEATSNIYEIVFWLYIKKNDMEKGRIMTAFPQDKINVTWCTKTRRLLVYYGNESIPVLVWQDPDKDNQFDKIAYKLDWQWDNRVTNITNRYSSNYSTGSSLTAITWPILPLSCFDPGYSRCLNGNCVSTTSFCNGINDCGDTWDEIWCSRNYTKH